MHSVLHIRLQLQLQHSAPQPQELLELTETGVTTRVRSKKAAAKLSREVQHLQSTWLQVKFCLDPILNCQSPPVGVFASWQCALKHITKYCNLAAKQLGVGNQSMGSMAEQCSIAGL